MMNNRYLAAALAAMVSTGLTMSTAVAHAAKPGQEKCYGIVKKGKNDCGTSKHACAGQAKKNNDPQEWIYLPKGSCAKITGGKTKS